MGWRFIVLWLSMAAIVGLLFLGAFSELARRLGDTPARDAATAWGAVITAGMTMAMFLVGRMVQELERQFQRNEARVDLAVALYAEIASNLARQRRVITAEAIDKKLVSEFGAARPAALSQGTTAEKPGATADESDPIFLRAVENYERVPQPCIFAVVRYYNLNGMLNTAIASVSQRALAGMERDQKKQTLVEFYRLADETDEAASLALTTLRGFIERHGSKAARDMPQNGGSRVRFDQAAMERRIDEIMSQASLALPGSALDLASSVRRSEGSDPS